MPHGEVRLMSDGDELLDFRLLLDYPTQVVLDDVLLLVLILEGRALSLTLEVRLFLALTHLLDQDGLMRRSLLP